MNADRRLQVKFWGVRGSTPTPQAENLGYGGNTPCIEVRYADQPVVILDAGTGIRQFCLSRAVEGAPGPLSANILLTHFHWDHIQGIPFMTALHRPDSDLTFYSARPAAALGQILRRQMTSPFFPVEMRDVPMKPQYRQIGPAGAKLGDLTIRPFPLCHPNGAVGYRIESPQACVVYATDHEHGNKEHDSTLGQFAHGADLLIYDAQFTPQEYENRKGWGHSTWVEATRFARDQNVKRLALFHHDPEHDDETITKIVEQAKQQFENTIGSQEGWSVSL